MSLSHSSAIRLVRYTPVRLLSKVSSSNQPHPTNGAKGGRDDDGDDSGKEKPNLRNAPMKQGTAWIGFVCLAVAISVAYPVILRPFFGLSSLDAEKTNEVRSRLAETRPGFLPAWSSPFGPKKSGDK